ncbi:MAG TPA: exodeoxyribonuclease V subunit alpha [Methylococcaceae bacterium]|nr:exodeoxyribonuclease V subunit alpha [Methylococcaceae bacterium]
MTQPLFEFLANLVERKALTHLNVAFAKFLHHEAPSASDSLLLLATLVSYRLNQGDVYLDVNALFAQPAQALLPFEEVTDEDIAQLNTYLAIKNLNTLFAQSPLVSTGEGNSPLVWDAGNQRLYLRRYWRYQQTVDEKINMRVTFRAQALPEAIVERLKGLFDKSSPYPNWQKVACALALRSRFCIITGGPGTGKTTTLTKLLALAIERHLIEHSAQSPIILLAAPTGKAANRVNESIGRALTQLQSTIPPEIAQYIPSKASTLHRLLGSRPDTRLYRYSANNRLIADIVIVDEASMVDLEMMAALLDALQDRTQLILLGDKDQLSSVEPGYVLGNLCAGAENKAYDESTLAWIKKYADVNITHHTQGSTVNQQTAMLLHSYRFVNTSGIGNLAHAVNTGCVERAGKIINNTQTYPDLRKIQNANQLREYVTTYNTSLGSYQDYRVEIKNRPAESACIDKWALEVLKAFDRFQVLCATRQGVWGVEQVNACIEQWLFGAQPTWYEGRPIMVTSNDYNLNLMNGDIGIALNNQDGRLQVAFIDTTPQENAVAIRWVSPLRLAQVETAFAMTVHKSQGSEFSHVVLALPERENLVLTPKLLYTAITRAKENFTLLESSEGIFEKSLK